MNVKFSILLLISVYFSFSYGRIKNVDYIDPKKENNPQELLNQFEDKMKALFDLWKTETNLKLDSVEQMIPDLGENINRKLYNLRNSILDKLEEYIDGKVNNLEKNIYKKLKKNMDSHSEVLNKKIEKFEDNFNYKLEVHAKNILKKLDGNINCKSDAFKKITELEDNMNRKFEDLKELQSNINCTCNALKNETDYVMKKPSVPCKEEYVANQKYTQVYSIDYVSPYQYVTQKRNSTGHLTYLEIHFAAQADAAIAIDLVENENFSGIRYVLDVGIESPLRMRLYFGHSSYVHNIETPDILSSTAFKAFYIIIDDGKLQFGEEGETPLISNSVTGIDSLKYYTFSSWYGSAVFRYCPAAVEESPCKEERLRPLYGYDPFYSMDNVTLNHVTLKKDSTGLLTYFEIHIAIKEEDSMSIWMTDNETILDSDIQYYIAVGGDINHNYTYLYNNVNSGSLVQRMDTPNILSSAQFRAFYIKIDNGHLIFAKEGDSSPIISYYNDHFRSIEYFQFGRSGEGQIRYDCPVPVTEFPCKEERLRPLYGYDPFYSMDNVTLNHVTLKKDSTGLLTYFEIHIAIKEEDSMSIWMTDKKTILDSDIQYYIAVGGDINHNYTYLYNNVNSGSLVQRMDTPNILSSAQFRAFYIKIDNGHLIFAKEGDSSPIISYYNNHFRSINFFQFGRSGEGQIRYDCPVPVTGSS